MALIEKPINLIGTELHGPNGRYAIDALVAQGGMGAVFHGRELQRGRPVAIKAACLDPEKCQDPELRHAIQTRLRLELRTLAALDYPTIPKVYDQFSSEHNEFLVIEFIQGQTLMAIFEQAQSHGQLIEEGRVIGWLIQALDTLTYLHTRPTPVLHRDIKPENLILAPDGRLVLIDFGLLKQMTGETPFDQIGENYGTIEFAPPEQYSESDFGTDERSDLYSLAACMYFLLTGQLPTRPEERAVTWSVDVEMKLPAIRKINPTVSYRTDHILRRALSLDPDVRYPSAAAMRAAICPPVRCIRIPSFRK